ncbi:AN1-type zinc finger protein 5-like [Grus japonensis]|uniref:AN1-type zinc finger protein 5-like n=1 Tax=Grus japonensis TaxID=30415 RepID=A0ABC9WYV2_GRUJA
MEKTMVRQAVPLQHMEVDGADIHLQPMEDPTLEQVETPEGGCDPMGSPCWSRNVCLCKNIAFSCLIAGILYAEDDEMQLTLISNTGRKVQMALKKNIGSALTVFPKGSKDSSVL